MSVLTRFMYACAGTAFYVFKFGFRSTWIGNSKCGLPTGQSLHPLRAETTCLPFKWPKSPDLQSDLWKWSVSSVMAWQSTTHLSVLPGGWLAGWLSPRGNFPRLWSGISLHSMNTNRTFSHLSRFPFCLFILRDLFLLHLPPSFFHSSSVNLHFFFSFLS